MIPMLADHVWQSTIFALAAGALTLAFRRNRASVRFWLWFAASAKFLVPFAALVVVASQFVWQPSVTPAPTVTSAIGVISQPFSRIEVRLAPDPSMPGAPSPMIPIAIFAVWLTGVLLAVMTWSVRWRRVAAAVREGSPMTHGRVPDALRNLEQKSGVANIAVVSSAASLEPGVFGIWNPILLWPLRMDERLDHQQVAAIIAHEVCHVRRRDNLLASLHMLVEALFWFHPVVWWVRAGLVRERERACDEEVLMLGSEPRTYAESILKTCEFCVSSPVPNVSGVSGADLKTRIERIMTNVGSANLTVWKKALLVIVGVAAIAGPVGAGVVNAAKLRAQTSQAGLAAQVADATGVKFDVASVKANKSGTGGSRLRSGDGQFEAINVSLASLIQNAYRLPGYLVSGGPAWLTSDRFDIIAKAPERDRDPGDRRREDEERRQMLRDLLRERFHLVVHVDTKELPVYELVLARTDGRFGPDMRKAPDCTKLGDCAPGPGSSPARGGGGGGAGVGIGAGAGAGYSNSMRTRGPIVTLASTLTSSLDRVVLDRTALQGDFDVELKWNTDSPSIFTAVQEQLGLKLQPAKGPVEMLIIDRAEHPAEN